MQITAVAVTRINPAPYNPRKDLKPGDAAYEKLKRSITEFGYVEPLVWNKQTGNLVGGHQRFKVLKELGNDSVDVVVVDLPPEKEKALNIALNKIQGEWDESKLAQLLHELIQIPEFDTGLTGFDVPEINKLFDRQTSAQEDDYDVEAAVAAIDQPITQKGDLIELGPHRLLCGDASDSENLKILLDGIQPHLLHTDPPYNVDYYGGRRPHAQGRPKPSRQWDRIYADDMTQEQYEDWLSGILNTASSYLVPGAACYIWNGHRQFGPMYQILAALDVHVSCVITWAKPNFAIGYGDYSQQTEFCLYGWKQGGSHRWFGPSNESTLWEIKRDATKEYVHPTQKPIALAQRAMRNSSLRDEVVLDLFLGSGSTLIAAESLGRRCYGTEIDPKYCDVIVRRYMTFAGQNAVSAEVRGRYLQEVANESR